MIASVHGTVLSIGLDHAVVEVGGVGLSVHATPNTLATLRRGETTRLATSLVVREDSLTLYGFAEEEARELFVLLQSASGVGPRLALAMVAVLSPDQLRSALSDGNITVLTQVPGIGRKSAERLVIELRDKVDAVAAASGATTADDSRIRSEVTEALVGLGFSGKQAEQTVETVLANDAQDMQDTSAVLRQALATLGPKS